MKKEDKKGIAIEGLVWWIIAVAVLVIIVILAVVLRDKLGGIAGYLKSLFRFRS
ncbi:MAG: hypothetical protein PHH54_04150 [Candidatus Nanoarchaeia archaeon]|nr:hypothetical protein [Candidatus Nanoarchaeia archaeon]MDD5741152.1 hypothetical protein [Candidatus Nanoarchaeia archaeon]